MHRQYRLMRNATQTANKKGMMRAISLFSFSRGECCLRPSKTKIKRSRGFSRQLDFLYRVGVCVLAVIVKKQSGGRGHGVFQSGR
jgi:hypothetical protein